jgi:hypothetical protein
MGRGWLAALVLVGCHTSSEAAGSAPAPGSVSAAARAAASASASAPASVSAPAVASASAPTGPAVEVRLTFDGKPRPRWPIPSAFAAHCGAAADVPDPSLELDDHGGVSGAVVWLDDVAVRDEPPTRVDTTQDERGCTFLPHVLAMVAGAKLRLTNGDPANHAVRLELFPERASDTAVLKMIPPNGEDAISTSPAWAGRVARVTCPIHPWMLSWVHFFDHRFFAVTRGGVARIEGVPAGAWHLSVWHEALDAKLGETVTEGEPVRGRFDVKVDAKDVLRPLVLHADGVIR